MAEATYVVDSHALLWYFEEDPRLSPRALQILSGADLAGSNLAILVPTIVLAELLGAAEKRGRLVQFQEMLARLDQTPGFRIVPFDEAVFKGLLSLGRAFTDLHDRIIVATAKLYDATLISKDEVLIRSRLVEILW